MALVRRLVDLGRQARAESKVEDPPAARPGDGVGRRAGRTLPAELQALVSAELNVVALEPLAGDLVDVTVKANFRALGKRFGKGVQAVAAAVAAADAAALAADLRAGTASRRRRRRAGGAVAGRGRRHRDAAHRLGRRERRRRDRRARPRHHPRAAAGRAWCARSCGWCRTRARRSGLEVSDRIELWWQASGELAEALEEGSARLAEEVLAVRVEHGPAAADVAVHADADLGLSFQLRVAGA